MVALISKIYCKLLANEKIDTVSTMYNNDN